MNPIGTSPTESPVIFDDATEGLASEPEVETSSTSTEAVRAARVAGDEALVSEADALLAGLAADPMMAMMAGLSQMMAPAMMGMSIGSMVGRLGLRAFGQYDLPVPRTSGSLLVVPRIRWIRCRCVSTKPTRMPSERRTRLGICGMLPYSISTSGSACTPSAPATAAMSGFAAAIFLCGAGAPCIISPISPSRDIFGTAAA